MSAGDCVCAYLNHVCDSYNLCSSHVGNLFDSQFMKLYFLLLLPVCEVSDAHLLMKTGPAWIFFLEG